MFVESSTQYTSFSSRKKPANAGTERKQFTENASVALQQPILTHAYTKCPPVDWADLISTHIQLIFNSSLANGIFPDNWKSARVTPLFRHGERSVIDNYRPILVISL